MSKIIQIIALFLSVVFVVSAQIPTDSLVAWYPFNGNANDASGNGNNGTLNNATLTSDRFGNANSAIDFKYSNSFINVPDNNTSLSISNVVSISVWVKKRTQRQEWAGLLYKGRQGYENYAVGFDANNNSYNASINDGYWHTFGTIAAFPDTENWEHVVFIIRASGVINIYVNGQNYPGQWWIPDAPAYSLTKLPMNDSSLWIGKGNDQGLNGETFNGEIDNIRIYKRELTVTDISSLYQENISILKAAVASINGSGNMQVLLTFDKPVDTFLVSAINIDSIFPLSKHHSWLSGFGSIGSAVWNPESTMLLVTLSSMVSAPSIAIGDTITYKTNNSSTVITGNLTSVTNSLRTQNLSLKSSKDIKLFDIRGREVKNANNVAKTSLLLSVQGGVIKGQKLLTIGSN